MKYCKRHPDTEMKTTYYYFPTKKQRPLCVKCVAEWIEIEVNMSKAREIAKKILDEKERT